MELRDCNGLTEAEFLEQYRQEEYPKPALTVDMAVFRSVKSDYLSNSYSDSLNSLSNSLEVLLIKRGGHPYLGCWALPGGFVEPGETATAAALRELEEETGFVDIPLEQLGIYSEPGRDPRGWTASEGYLALVEAGTEPSAGDDAADARWFSISVKRSQDVLNLTATSGEEVLRCSFTLDYQQFTAPRVSLISSKGFAFDHAQIVAEAYMRISYK